MLVILAGAGASKAVEKNKYPCTVEFMNHLPPKIQESGLYKLVLQSIQADQHRAIIDVEDVLSALEVIAVTCERIGDPGSVVGYLFAQNRFRNIDTGLSDLTQSVTACNHIGSRVRGLADDINEQVIRIYGPDPTTAELSDNWLTLLPLLHEQQADVELFTTNYDLVIECALAACKSPLRTGRNQGIVNDLDVSLWSGDRAEVHGLFTKLHGSIDWRRENDGRIYVGNKHWAGQHARHAIIYPAYKDEPTKSPFLEFHDYFKRAIREATEILVIGFAFRDAAINRALELRNPGAKIVVIDPATTINAPKAWNVDHVQKGFGAEGIADALTILRGSITAKPGVHTPAP